MKMITNHVVEFVRSLTGEQAELLEVGWTTSQTVVLLDQVVTWKVVFVS